jgi:disease resistance protein RPM1
MASLLVDAPRDRWFEVYKSIGFGCKENEEAENIMKKILSFSYYDLPPHLRTCLLYLSAFPEDSVIPKVPLVWMWVAEGFVQKKKGKGLFETGEGYFNDLINRSLIQEVESDYDALHLIHGCRVHDMVLDFIRSISCEKNFFIVFDNNDQGTLVPGNVVRRLAHHNKTMVLSNQANMFDMSKVRSFISMDTYIVDTWAPLISSFKLLRVLNIGGYYSLRIGSVLRVEPLGQLLHLRFLGINERQIQKIPKEIGGLKMLQTLDLMESWILEAPSNSSFPTQLLCLRIFIKYSFDDSGAEMFSVGRLTSLEELSIGLSRRCEPEASRRLVKELGSLRELRVLNAFISLEDEDEMKRDLLESVRHLHKLQHLKISCYGSRILFRRQEMKSVLLGDLRYLELGGDIVLWKLPSCINPLCHRKLSHLDLRLQYMDEQELKTLGGLPELRFLGLDLEGGSSPTIRNINDSDVCYFPKLRQLVLRRSMVLFVASKGDDGKKTVSFHIWDGKVDDSVTKQPSASDSELQGDDESSSVFQWEAGRGPVGEKSDEELQLLSSSDDVDPPSRPSFQPSKLQHVSDDGEGAAAPRFMPRLQVLHFRVREQAVWDPRYCNNIGLEFLSSLQEIRVTMDRRFRASSGQVNEVKAALRSAAQVHPNHPTLHIIAV